METLRIFYKEKNKLKRKFSKILGVGLTLSLLISLLLTAAPVSALTQPGVDVSPDEISVTGGYVITFQPSDELTAGDTITVRFPEDTVVPEQAVFNPDSWDLAAGMGWIGGSEKAATTANITAVSDEDDLTVVFTLVGADEIGETARVRIEFLTGGTHVITNPTEPGAYTLEVKTSEETDYVESEVYDIDAPVVGGFVYVYNPSNVLMATFGGSGALNDCVAYHNDDDFVIKVGPGTYVLTGNVTLSGEGLILESSEGAEDTIIDADTFGIIVTGDDVIIQDFTIDDAGTAVNVSTGLDALITNCVITDATVAGIAIAATVDIDTTVSNNVIEDCATGITFAAGAPTDLGDVDITDNEITEANTLGAIVFAGGNVDIDITGNTITGNECSGIYFANGGQTSSDIDIKNNTITLNEGSGIEIVEPTAANAPADLIITGNDISANEDDGLVAASWDEAESYLMFNDIYDNESDAVDNNCAADEEVNAYFNWWGSAVEDDFDGELAGDVNYEPWLLSTQATATAGFDAAVADASSLDAKDDCGVNVTGMDDDAGNGADIIIALQYPANPEDAIDDAIAFYDVFVLLDDTVVALDEVSAKLKFYDGAITEASVASFWTGDFWAECSDQLARAGVLYVDLTEDTVPSFDEMGATPFVVVAGEAVTALAAPLLLAPAVGADDVALTPTFAWGAVADADGYDFQLASNADFVLPLTNLTGDAGRLTVTAYAYVGELPYTTPYYWRVKAVSATEESDWASGVFITMAEPEEATPPIEIVEQPAQPAPVITIEQPDIVVPLPDVASITPSWIYVIIGVGGLLVIAVIVLIVRTRRVV